jgi:hypothetical protein
LTSVAPKIAVTSIADIISARDYCDMVIFILKWMSKLHPYSIFDVLDMHRKLII